MSARGAGLGAPALPQVNLLPPEVRTARTVRRVKGWMLIGVALSFVVVALGYLLGMMIKGQAADELEAARNETNALLAEQQQYAEVPRVQQALADAQIARTIALGAEVVWTDYLRAIEVIIGDDVSIDTVNVQQVLASDEPAPLEPEAVAVMTLGGMATTVPDGAALADALEALPGLESVTVASVEVDGDDDETRWWNVTISARVTVDALASRWTPEETEDTAEGEED